YGMPWKNPDTGLTTDPFDSYGPDDDRPPSPLDPDHPFAERKPSAGAWDAFALNPDDNADLRSASDRLSALRGYGSMCALPLPRRLHWLAVWVAGICDQPVAAWWAAGQTGLHPDLQLMVRHTSVRLKRGQIQLIGLDAIVGSVISPGNSLTK